MSFNKEVADTFRSIKQDFTTSTAAEGSRAGGDKQVHEAVTAELDKIIDKHDAPVRPHYIGRQPLPL